MIRPTSGGGGVVVSDSEAVRLGGGSGAIELRDLDDDGKPEILASVRFNRGKQTWLFAWRGGQLVWIGPRENDSSGRAITATADPEVLDVDGDGVAELVEPSHFPEDAGDEGTVYSLSRGTYLKRTTLRFFGRYLRGKGTPVVQSSSFAAMDGSKDFQLRIVNGDDAGDNRSSSAVVRLNGAVVAGPDLFKPKSRAIVVPIVLGAANRLEVEMRGEPESVVSVIVERSAPAALGSAHSVQ